MNKKNGFTLIELLAVIVILAVIALISTPIIIGVIDKARKGAFENSAYGILDAGKLYFTSKLAEDNRFLGETFTFPGDTKLKLSGEKPSGGSLVISADGRKTIAIYDKDKKWCAYKDYTEEKITIKDYKEDECKISASLMGAAKTITDKNTPGNTEGLFTDDFGNVRYRGRTVKNNVTFNDERWNIIGVFDGKVKLIRSSIIPSPNNSSNPYGFKWDSHTIATGAETDYGKNDWSTSDLKDYLNVTYYNSLNETSKSMIEDTKYNLGGIRTTAIMKKEAYEEERGTVIYTGRPTEWTGKIALMYLSDYGYSAGEGCTKSLNYYNDTSCSGNNWLNKISYNRWTLTSWSSVSTVAYLTAYKAGGGSARGAYAGREWYSVEPTLHLKSNILITSGDGTPTNPYLLKYE